METTIISRLKAIRKALGLTQKDFAARVGIAYAVIRDNEQGVRSITDRTIRLICDQCGVNEKWLRGGGGRMFVDAQRDAFDQFAAAFNLDDEQKTRIAEIIRFPLKDTAIGAAAHDEETRLRAARIVDAIDRGSIGRVVNVGAAR
ncbi:MAG: helix-turn-helix transcriptional regulator [Selenomonadaceae bacterium]|nr:helix-turn-helix transcriptional regulator [Selenomonadaceae bacterium]